MNSITNFVLILIQLITVFAVSAQQSVNININVEEEPVSISPLIYGKNNCLSDSKSQPLSASQWQRLRDLGIRMFRENGGNNSTKYNWTRKLSSHPDWYNNVYAHDWDYAAQSLLEEIPSAQGMWAFQLIGKAAKSGSFNFNDWAYNHSQWWDGVAQNLCGGGQVNPAGGPVALTEGDPSLYLVDWPADSTTGILDHWFGNGGIGLDTARIRYWNMDNEPEIWNGTHDDVWPEQPDAESFMQLYFAVAKKARALYPGIKLVGPVPANEWQWYNWKNDKISYKGKTYVWLEYFILRIAEEQQESGIRLLDMLDIHFYPGESNPTDIVQLHRVFFDTNYNYPGANGVKRSGSGGWDNSITKEFIFVRCREWLVKYLGISHGVGFSVTETGINGDNPNVTACWYASMLGEFARQGVVIFTPWSWKTGMDEVIHLFSRYGHEFYLNVESSDEEFVSAYPTINFTRDSMTIFLVNRHLTGSQSIVLDLTGFPADDGRYAMYTLSGLPQSETFVSHSVNALKSNVIEVRDHKVGVQLAPLSVTAIVLTLGSFLTDTSFNVMFKVINEYTLNPVFGAGISLDSVMQVTNTAGETVFKVDGGSLPYMVSTSAYQDETGTLDIQSDTTIYVYLVQTHADVKFRLKDGTAPVNKAMVVVNGDSIVTNSIGIAHCRQLPVPAHYAFLISKNGYATEQGSFYLATDTTLDFAMKIQTAGPEQLTRSGEPELWPNPADDILNFHLPGNHTDILVCISDVRGIAVYQEKVSEYARLQIGDLRPGIYIIQTITRAGHSTQYFIKE